MADLILSPLLQVVIDKLASPFLEKFQNLYNFKDNIRKLQHSLPMIQALLEDANKQQETQQAVKQWLMKLEDAAYELEDLLDELAVEISMCEHRSSKGKEVVGMFFPFKPTSHLFELASKLQHKLEELDKIAEQAFGFNLQQAAVEKPYDSSGRSRETMSYVVESKIYGREGDKQNILDLLLLGNKGKSTEGLPVISIVGIGGLGKTTVAQLVFNDVMVNRHFDLKMWIHVSENFDVGKIMRSAIESASKKSCELCGLDLLQSQLQDSLRGKRFLLVLDDVWNEDQHEWEVLSDLLRGGAEGSTVLITTRSTKVASITGTKIYQLKELNDDNCWNLFKQQAFSRGEDSGSSKLFAIGKEIIRKCGGLPLAAKTLGSLLRFKKEEYWMSVQDSELWHLKECQSAILPALRLSYLSLPPHLKRCFAFCSLFPKNHEIHREKMIYIWMAQGLILPDGGKRLLEDIGGDYFDDLLSLSFFQEVQRNDNANTAVYKMHDLLHDLARTIGGYDFAMLGHAFAPSNLARMHHLSIVCNFDHSSLPEDLFEAKHLRTLIFLSPGGSSDDFTSFWPVNFIYLRVFNLSGCGIKKLDEKVSALLCLRYLDLSNNPIQKLPQTICNLYNLQTLDLFGCHNLVELPFGIPNLTSLRHLNIKGCEALTHMPAMVGKLVHIQTLPIYIVGRRPSESIAQLQFLNLRNELHIKCMENIRDAKEAKSANMREKKHLQSLRLQWGSSSGSKDLTPEKGTSSSNSSLRLPPKEDGEDVEIILKYLEPHSHLQNLYMKGYPGRNFPAWDLPNLTVVELINCRRCVSLPKLGQLPFLERLHLQGMNSITHVSEVFYGGVSEPFPLLKYLTIRDFPYLEEWSSFGTGVPFPCLEKLVLDKCPKLTIAPPFPSIQHLELHCCHAKIMESMETATSLSSLVIDKLPELEYISGTFLQDNYSLEFLEIRSCQNLHLLPSELENLITLKSLIISCCEKLTDLPPGLHKLESLELLDINGCHSLTLLPYQEIKGLRSLKNLSIENCSNLISFSSGFHHLTALEQLSIMSCPKLTSFPDGFQNLSALRSLSIISCPELISLPVSLQHATALQSVVIHSCPGLTALPEWFRSFSSLRSLAISNCKYIKSLPEGLQCLTKLQHVSIQDCPLLEKLCKKQKGKEWQKIAHIPHIYIGSLKLC